MNKKIATSIFLFFTISLFIFSGCEKNTDIVSSNTNTNVDGAEFAVLDYNDVMDTFIEPDIENDPQFGEFPIDPMGLMGDGNGGRIGSRGSRNNGLHLGRILRAMELTEDQITEIRSLMETHKEMMQVLFEQFKEASASIMEYGREQHQAIKEQLQNGDITREEARRLMQALGEEIKEMLANDETTSAIREQMCATRDNLFSDIASLLTSDQLELWNTWVENHPGRC